MSGFVDKAVSALLKRGQMCRFHRIDGQKIADITHADTNEHTLSPADLGLPNNTVAILAYMIRMGGTGTFLIYTKTGTTTIVVQNLFNAIWAKDDAGDFRYKLNVANDDWDIVCQGYWTQGRLAG